jgi:5-methylcytosine-specific restriction enzyme subunit McrC
VQDHSCIIVAPKLDTRIQKVKKEKVEDKEIEIDVTADSQLSIGINVNIDYFALLKKCLQTDYLYSEIEDLIYIDWKAKEIPIHQSEDWLSPLLIVKFLNVLKSIVRKGLKKSYYLVTQNLQSKVKGKILVGANIKQNVLHNRFTRTVCQFQEFGIDNIENRLLLKAFQFACAYLDNYNNVFGKTQGKFTDLINYCRPAFISVGNNVSDIDMKHYKPNPFYKEYTDGIRLAKLILKRYAYTISNTAKQIVSTPPYWIDMPRLFELYTYNFLKRRFQKKNELFYHLSTYGNELDFLLNSERDKIVVDAKYKPLYIYGKNHNDIRQLSGYARLSVVREKLGFSETDNQLIDCLIIYPDVEKGLDEEQFNTTSLTNNKISGYQKIFKIGIKLPVI